MSKSGKPSPKSKPHAKVSKPKPSAKPAKKASPPPPKAAKPAPKPAATPGKPMGKPARVPAPVAAALAAAAASAGKTPPKGVTVQPSKPIRKPKPKKLEMPFNEPLIKPGGRWKPLITSGPKAPPSSGIPG